MKMIFCHNIGYSIALFMLLTHIDIQPTVPEMESNLFRRNIEPTTYLWNKSFGREYKNFALSFSFSIDEHLCNISEVFNFEIRTRRRDECIIHTAYLDCWPNRPRFHHSTLWTKTRIHCYIYLFIYFLYIYWALNGIVVYMPSWHALVISPIFRFRDLYLAHIYINTWLLITLHTYI